MMNKTPLYIKNMMVMGMAASTTARESKFKDLFAYEFENAATILSEKIDTLVVVP
jgi:hypothetical protein